MSTATANTAASLYQRLADLTKLARDFEEDYRARVAEAEEKRQKRDEALREIAELTTQAQGGSAPSNGTTAPAKATTPAPARPQPKHRNAARTAAREVTRNAAPAGGPKKGQAVAVAAGGKRKKFNNSVTLPEAVWEVLDRNPHSYKKYIHDYPKDANGCRTVEVKEIIEQEKKWRSSSSNITNMVQNVLLDLRKQGKLGRGDDSRYFIVEGAELHGPPLNEDGTPMERQPDGTFKDRHGATLLDLNKRPVKARDVEA